MFSCRICFHDCLVIQKNSNSVREFDFQGTTLGYDYKSGKYRTEIAMRKYIFGYRKGKCTFSQLEVRKYISYYKI
uniref:KTSC domain-containing protein n=1 Tax=Caenorhabditis tropicalis TaxID=1561998 RepID=A0A1I7U7Q1_9PELO